MPNTTHHKKELIFAKIKKIIKTVIFSLAKLLAIWRSRIAGVGIKKLGFIERAYKFALENGEFLPHYLTLERFLCLELPIKCKTSSAITPLAMAATASGYAE